MGQSLRCKDPAKISSVVKSTDGILPVQEAMHFKKSNAPWISLFPNTWTLFFIFFSMILTREKKWLLYAQCFTLVNTSVVRANVNHLHLTHLNILQLHHCKIFIKYTYMTPCKCFGSCYIYYIPLMTIPSCKSIFITCGCILHGSTYIFCNGPLWPITKNHDTRAIGHY